MAKGTVAAMSCDPATSGFQMTESYADVAPSGYTYDAAGDVTYDGVNNYAYDGEGRLCAMQYVTGIGSPGPIVGYIYDAEGTRVAKGTLTSWSCNPATNGFTATASYVLGLGGEELTEMTVTGNPTSGYTSTWNHTNVFGGGKLVASYYGTDTYFAFTDWLGTKRAEYTPDGTSALYSSLPYGDGLSSSGSAADATEHHFTGKERDTESGNDYFDARYYSSAMGRFMSPDWSAKEEPVPYAKLDNPQTLNLYGYMRNNPLGGVDQDGHCSGDDCGKVSVTATTSGDAPLESSNGGRTATAEGTVQYSFTYNKGPLANTQIHEDISNKSTRDGVPEKAKLTTSDDATGPKNGNPPGVVTDTSSISISTPFGGAEGTMENSVSSKDTTQTLSFQTPTGSSLALQSGDMNRPIALL